MLNLNNTLYGKLRLGDLIENKITKVRGHFSHYRITNDRFPEICIIPEKILNGDAGLKTIAMPLLNIRLVDQNTDKFYQDDRFIIDPNVSFISDKMVHRYNKAISCRVIGYRAYCNRITPIFTGSNTPKGIAYDDSLHFIYRDIKDQFPMRSLDIPNCVNLGDRGTIFNNHDCIVTSIIEGCGSRKLTLALYNDNNEEFEPTGIIVSEYMLQVTHPNFMEYPLDPSPEWEYSFGDWLIAEQYSVEGMVFERSLSANQGISYNIMDPRTDYSIGKSYTTKSNMVTLDRTKSIKYRALIPQTVSNVNTVSRSNRKIITHKF